ncbi:small subunit ribosomal protein S9e [Nematocida parisii]|uniref:30S ribosomal protein S4 n=1 Tax=Nematocida parisii (strain ERTm3) TaxID=935791 RepID=I3EHP1_NEMP3|nr:30S ribosomal protein S4 [Nematocida parisii ERTm1]EIJ88738.1 30S ribosomal protein S4 [Nematocida parisii ERTm3]KAI5127027.1 small subunit ribosomal protein S9e [Nematocida parisii]KAI5165035.1 small subunit ribosomal protein S9e [Nematocida sp. AWRm79]KAI5182470.1 small subunit ribosomal protein S9e [Nematocida sp. AWRm78]OAG30509.1 small subunit ribosomal protein S9e [Nematocida sp. ERTm5]|eukprot:XP_013058350.1 30S ribosomal protein S4 [Nematocida parisii ERTm1]
MASPTYSKRAGSVRRPFDKQRLINEMKYVGEYGLKSKRELRVLEKIFHDVKRRAKDLLINTDEDYQMVQGRALLHRLEKQGLITGINYQSKKCIITELEKILDLEITSLLNRRLQTKVLSLGLAKSIHHARVLIHQGHISVNGAIVNKPGFIVAAESEGYIEISPNSTLMGNKPGRAAKKVKAAASE